MLLLMADFWEKICILYQRFYCFSV